MDLSLYLAKLSEQPVAGILGVSCWDIRARADSREATMLNRTRLLRLIADVTSRQVLIEAGAGYGKTVLLDQLRTEVPSGHKSVVVLRPSGGDGDAAHLRADLVIAARRTIGAEWPEDLGSPDVTVGSIANLLVANGCALAIDDAHVWDDDATRFLLALADEMAGRVLFLIAGRFLGPLFDRLRRSPAWRELDGSELAFSLLEVEDLLATYEMREQEIANRLHAMCGGWPVAVATAASRLDQTPDPSAVLDGLSRQNSLVDTLLHGIASDVDPVSVDAAVVLAKLPFFDEQVAKLVGSDATLERLGVAGIPITRRPDGWMEIENPFRVPLARRRSQASTSVSDLAKHYLERGEIRGAVRSCLALGEHELAAQIIAELTPTQQALLEPDSLNAAMNAIGAAADRAPRALLVQAQVNAIFGRVAEGLPALQRAANVFSARDAELAEADHVEVLLELGAWKVLHGEYESARDIMDRCEAKIPAAAGTLRAKWHDLEGLVQYSVGTNEALEQAARSMSEALAIWRQLSEQRAATVTTFRLASGVLASLGRRPEALALLDELEPVTQLDEARLGLERAVLLPYLGRAAEVDDVLAEPMRIARVLDHTSLLGWGHWARIVAASVDGDGDLVERLIDEFAAAGWHIYNDHTQALMFGDSAEALARCERPERAWSLLRDAQRLCDVPDPAIVYVEASLEARFGDPEIALTQLAGLSRRDDIERERRWRIAFMQAVAAWRLGDEDRQAQFLSDALDDAAALDHRTLPRIVEARLFDLLQAEPANDPTAAPERTAVSAMDIQVMGGFAVTIGTDSVAIPAGNASTLVKLFVLNDGHLLVDQAIDALWPESDLRSGRKRLRNVVLRVRQSCGDVIERSGDSLALRADVTSDLARARHASKRALQPDATADVVDAAIRCNEGELLPSDIYESWTEAHRDDQRQLLIRLLDLQARLGEQDGDLDLVVTALIRADELDPFPSQRMNHARLLLRENGRPAAAAALPQ